MFLTADRQPETVNWFFMAELTQKERLQPSLLDRLRDDEPNKGVESREKRVFSIRKLREMVLRDLSWLLNTCNLNGTVNLENTPFVAKSVLNYGMQDLSGIAASNIDAIEIERYITKVIRDFEPRILPKTLKVRVVVTEQQMNHNAMTLEIEGDLWSQPLPLQLYLKTEIDLESGIVQVIEA